MIKKTKLMINTFKINIPITFLFLNDSLYEAKPWDQNDLGSKL